MTTKKSIFEQHKDTIKYIYGTILACSLYFGVTTKIELLTQKHEDDMDSIKFRVSALETRKTTNTDRNYDYNKYAVLPKEIKINNAE